MKVKSFEANVRRQVWKFLGDGLDQGADLLTEAIREKISIQGPPRSVPGEPPHMDTTALKEGYDYEVDPDDLRARVGSNQPYDAPLELEMDRPHVRSTLIERSSDIANEILKP